MDTESSSGWLFMSMMMGAIGAGFFIYGVRQKEPVILVVGVLLNVLPFAVSQPLLLLLLSVVVIAGGIFLKDRL